jgi:hypothetical protein
MLAVALGVAAVESGYTVRFARLDRWAQETEAADAAGELPRFLPEWIRPQLVILDEVAQLKLGHVASRAFCQLLTPALHDRLGDPDLQSRLRHLERVPGR